MNFCKVEVGRLSWIHLGDPVLPLPNVDWTTLLHRVNLYSILGDDKVVHATPHHWARNPSHVGPSCSSQPLPPDYTDLQNALRSIQKEHISIWAFVASDSTVLRDFVQERHDEFSGMLVTQTQYFQDYRACLETLSDWHISYG